MAVVKRETRVEQKVAGAPTSRNQPRLPVASLVLGGLALVGVLISIWMIFFYAPMDALQQNTQRIFYLHVPSAWLGMLAFVIMAVAGVVYLFKADERWDLAARAASELGTVFLTIALITGSLWGKPIWGTWWSWDPMLTAVLVLWFMFVAYLMLHSYMGRSHESARAAAVLAIVGVIDVPIIYEAANWWRTLHPGKMISPTGGLPPAAILTLMVSLTSFTLLFSFLMIQVYQLQKLQTLAQRLRALVE
ncbi:MAG TPA: cytochrome c biogenesis protein CcsA [Ktedonobacteraceae bacterium]|jgi:heme exporter protein C|nr:cytochrome c biogenesis protein CcsA [Ktedonobacteraceae bacterium]